jgi:hypothetical protein
MKLAHGECYERYIIARSRRNRAVKKCSRLRALDTVVSEKDNHQSKEAKGFQTPDEVQRALVGQ